MKNKINAPQFNNRNVILVLLPTEVMMGELSMALHTLCSFARQDPPVLPISTKVALQIKLMWSVLIFRRDNFF